MVAPLNPASVLFGHTRQAILSLMFTRPDESFYLREIVRRTGRGIGAVQRELAQLTACGILRRQRDRFFQANPDSPLFEPLKQLVVRTMGLADGLRSALQIAGGQIAIAFIFGSFVRGEQQRQSDVDVMIITRDENLTLQQLTRLLRKEQASIEREVNPFVLPAREFRSKWIAGNHFIRRVVAAEKVFLIGNDHELKRLAEERVDKKAPTKPAGSGRPARAGRT